MSVQMKQKTDAGKTAAISALAEHCGIDISDIAVRCDSLALYRLPVQYVRKA